MVLPLPSPWALVSPVPVGAHAPPLPSHRRTTRASTSSGAARGSSPTPSVRHATPRRSCFFFSAQTPRDQQISVSPTFGRPTRDSRVLAPYSSEQRASCRTRPSSDASQPSRSRRARPRPRQRPRPRCPRGRRRRPSEVWPASRDGSIVCGMLPAPPWAWHFSALRIVRFLYAMCLNGSHDTIVPC